MYQQEYVLEVFKSIGELKKVIATDAERDADKKEDFIEADSDSGPATVQIVGHGRAITEVSNPKQVKKKEPTRDEYEKENEEADGVRVLGDNEEPSLPAEESKGRD